MCRVPWNDAAIIMKLLDAGSYGLICPMINTKEEAEQFVSSEFGGFTVRDVLAELARPGRDPRREFRTARFTESVSEMEQLQPGMVLEGVVTNVTKFGAFVDIGVHQDGLVHISQLADRFIRDPAEVVSAGDIIRVTVLEVDTARKRIALTCRAQSGQRN